MRTTHIGVKATELQHQQTSLTLNQKHNVEPWGGIANPRTPLLAHAADKCISARSFSAKACHQTENKNIHSKFWGVKIG